LDDLTRTIALSLGAGWASGINLYAAILVLGYLGATGNVDLPAGMDVLSDPLVMLAAGFMYVTEFFADKIPGVDTAWDTLHTFIRIPAGAILAASAVGHVGAGPELAAALVGGTMAAASHAAKSGTRVLINTSPEPFTNWTASLLEDISVVVGLLTALHHPVVFLVLLAIFVLLLIWLLPKLWRGIKRVFGVIARWLGGGNKAAAVKPPDSASETPEPGPFEKDADR
jgi:hypothetical protein